jgi:DNA-binding MarR family transcriptional regulator
MKKIDMKNISSDIAAAPKKQTSAGNTNGRQVSRKVLVEKFDLHNSPGHLLRRCHSRARAIFDDLIGRDTGLSKQQVALMVTISHNPAATHAQLSEETGFDRNTLADTIDRLISKGLAVRERSPRDARAYEIRLTDEGQTQLEGLIPLSFEVQRKILEPLPEASRQHFIECLQILAGISESELAEASARTAKEIKPASSIPRSKRKE